MDGLLFDSERIVQRSWEIAGDELGIPHMGDVIYHTLGMNRAGRNEYFRKYIREDFPVEEFGKLTRDNFWKIVNKEGLPLKKGAKELLAYGKSQGYDGSSDIFQQRVCHGESDPGRNRFVF